MTTAPPTVAGRLDWVDHARGLAMILVVYGHSYRGVLDAGLVGADSWLPTLDFLIYTFHMPTFFLLSGMFAPAALARGARAFWTARLIGIVWPYLLWMSVELVLLTAFAGITNMGRVRFGVATYLWQPVSPYWFLYALFACNLLLFALRALPSVGLLATAATIYAITQSPLVTEPILQETGWGFLYFAIGAACSHRLRGPWSGNAARPWFPVLAGGTLTAGLALHYAGVPNDRAVPAAILGIGAILSAGAGLAGWAERRPAVRPVAFLGRISLTVLVVHILGTAGTRIILLRLFDVRSVWPHLLLGTAVGLGSAVFVQLVAEKLGIASQLGLPSTGARQLRTAGADGTRS